MFFLGWKLPGWIMALTAAGPLLHANKCNCSGFCPRLGGRAKYQKIGTIIPAIFDRDATENNVDVDAAKANCDVRHIVRAPPLRQDYRLTPSL
jgi:hypothetical protein